MYCKLFASLYQGTLRGRAHEILVFTNLLAHCDQDGTVDKHWRAIAEEVGLTLDEVKEAVISLESPDPESRSPEEDGARIVRLDDHRAWGWRVVNYPKYRSIRSAEDRRFQNRLAKRRQRSANADSQHGQQCQPRSATVSHGQPRSAQAEAEADIEAVPPCIPPEGEKRDTGAKRKHPSIEEVRLQAAKQGLPDSEAEKFFNHYEANGWRVGRNPMKSMPHAVANWAKNWKEHTYDRGPNRNNGAYRGNDVSNRRNAAMGMSPEDARRSGEEAAAIVARRSAERRAQREAERAASGSSGDD